MPGFVPPGDAGEQMEHFEVRDRPHPVPFHGGVERRWMLNPTLRHLSSIG